MKSWLEKNDIVMYSTHNGRKSVTAERFIRTIRNKIYKYITSVSKNVYIDKLDDTVDECSSVKWGHLAHLDPNSTNTILPTNPMGSSSTL